MAGLDDYQFFSTLREKDNPFWQKTAEDKEHHPTDTMDHFRRPTEFPENLLNPAKPSPNPMPPKPQTPRISELEIQKVQG